jgi:hypothetical protein
MNNHRHPFSSLIYRSIACIAVCLAALAIGARHASHAAEAHPQVHVSQFLGELPIGLLGKPLGSKVVVEGKRAEEVLNENPLAITSVDGQPLKEIAKLELPHFEQLKPKTRYVLEGYESGSFAGEPTWHNSRVQQSFQYRPTFVVTRVIEPKKEPN